MQGEGEKEAAEGGEGGGRQEKELPVRADAASARILLPHLALSHDGAGENPQHGRHH